MVSHDIRISVIIPVLNGERSIVRTLESILAQRYDNIEIIVIDGGSSDGTLALLERYKSAIHYLESGLDSGIANAFNRGISQASGDLVAILNSDDYWAQDTLATVATAFESQPDASVIYGSVIYHDPVRALSYRKDPCIDKMSVRMHLYHPAVFVARQAYLSIGAFDETYQYAMDCEWLHRALAKGLRFARADRVLAHMSLGGASDRAYRKALAEFRRSVVSHRLAPPTTARLYYYWFVTAKAILRLPVLRAMLQWKNNAQKKAFI